MWGTKARLIAELEDRVHQLMGQRDAAREDAVQHLSAAVMNARAFVCAEDETKQLQGRLAAMLLVARRLRVTNRAYERALNKVGGAK